MAAALRQALATNTWRAYAADWRHWSGWADQHQLPALPAESLDLARFLVAHVTVGSITHQKASAQTR